MSELPPNTRKDQDKPEPVAQGAKDDESIDISEHEEGSIMKRLLKHFFMMKPKEVWKRLVKDVIDPSARNIASDLIVGAKDLFLFGSDKTPAIGDGSTDYAGVSTGKKEIVLTDKEKSAFDFKNIVFRSRKDAMNILQSMTSRLAVYDEVTVGYFYDLANVKSDFTDYSYGWTHLKGADVRQKGQNWIIVLPPVVKLN